MKSVSEGDLVKLRGSRSRARAKVRDVLSDGNSSESIVRLDKQLNGQFYWNKANLVRVKKKIVC